MWGREWARRRERERESARGTEGDRKRGGADVAVSHPAGAVTVEQSVRGLLEQIDSLTPETSGTFRTWDGENLPW
jgi:hypothetical protein